MLIPPHALLASLRAAPPVGLISRAVDQRAVARELTRQEPWGGELAPALRGRLAKDLRGGQHGGAEQGRQEADRQTLPQRTPPPRVGPAWTFAASRRALPTSATGWQPPDRSNPPEARPRPKGPGMGQPRQMGRSGELRSHGDTTGCSHFARKPSGFLGCPSPALRDTQ